MEKTKLPKIVKRKNEETFVKHSISLKPDLSQWADAVAEHSAIPFSNVVAAALEKFREQAESEAQPA